MIIDFIILAVILISAAISFFRGFIREVLTIAGFAGGGFAALLFGPSLAPIFHDFFGIVDGEEPSKLMGMVPMPIVANLSAYALIFVGFVIIISLASHLISNAAKSMGLGPIDRTFGVLFGIARATLLLGLIYIPVKSVMSESFKEKYMAQSKTLFYIDSTSQIIEKFLPSSHEVEKDAKETANDIVNGQIKQQLLKHNMLQSGDEQTKTENADADQTSASKDKQQGYEREERNKLDDLFSQPTFNE